MIIISTVTITTTFIEHCKRDCQVQTEAVLRESVMDSRQSRKNRATANKVAGDGAVVLKSPLLVLLSGRVVGGVALVEL